MSTATEALVTEALKALEADPARAEMLCRAALQANPANGDARLVLSEALRRKGDLPEAHALAAAEVHARPNWFGAHRQLGVILGDLREPLPASLALRAAAELNPAHPTIWRELGDQLSLAGDLAGAQQAFARYGAAPPSEARLRRAAQALQANDIAGGESILASFLQQHPNDVVALRLLSEAQARDDRAREAEATLRRCLELAPQFTLARHNLGQLLMGLSRLEEALAEAQRLLLQDAANHGSRRLHAAILLAIGRTEEAIEIYERLLAEDPRHPGAWLTYGHALKTVGRAEDAVSAYRRSIALEPSSGTSYWSIANLKTAMLSDADVTQMRVRLGRTDLGAEERVNFLYALGKAREDAGDAAEAFASYAEGAALHRANVQYDPDRFSAFVARSRAQLTPDFFESRKGGWDALDPIFIVGLPRAGSTLIEQILASHSAIEGTQELGDLHSIAQRLTEEGGGEFYFDRMAELNAAERAALGERYLRTTRIQRRTQRPLFINKLPNDFRHVGLIQLILPNAKIIDARRHPMACGFSCFKQHFALGQTYTYDLTELGHYYADYVALMKHYDAVLPGRVHRVIHEELATDPEPQIRALLDYCGLPFEEACLRPHENDRAVRTPSAEQVRKPISAKGLDDWRKFEPYLGPLKQAMGPVLDAYPKAP